MISSFLKTHVADVVAGCLELLVLACLLMLLFVGYSLEQSKGVKMVVLASAQAVSVLEALIGTVVVVSA